MVRFNQKDVSFGIMVSVLHQGGYNYSQASEKQNKAEQENDTTREKKKADRYKRETRKIKAHVVVRSSMRCQGASMGVRTGRPEEGDTLWMISTSAEHCRTYVASEQIQTHSSNYRRSDSGSHHPDASA